jgi:hypothetical protein
VTETAPVRAGDLTARSISPSAKRHCGRLGAAVVQTVFERAVTLKTERDDLLVLAQEVVADGGGVIRVGGAPAWPKLVQPGMLARITPSVITLPNFRLDLRAAAVWRPPDAPRQARPADVQQTLRSAATAARAQAKDGLGALAGVGLPAFPDPVLDTRILRVAEPLVRRLLQAIEAGDATAAGEAAGDLAGLGPGVTPSGDDLLVGTIIGLRYAGRGRAVQLAMAANAASRTTWSSGQLLSYALAGEAGAPLLGVAVALLQAAEETELQPRLAELFAVGETSGADALVGLLLGLRAGLSGAQGS